MCAGIQSHCSDKERRERPGWQSEKKTLNDRFCRLKLSEPEAAAGLHANFGPATNCIAQFEHAVR